MPTAPIASGPSGPTISVSTRPMATQPISATTTGAASVAMGRNSCLKSSRDGSIEKVYAQPLRGRPSTHAAVLSILCPMISVLTSHQRPQYRDRGIRSPGRRHAARLPRTGSGRRRAGEGDVPDSRARRASDPRSQTGGSAASRRRPPAHAHVTRSSGRGDGAIGRRGKAVRAGAASAVRHQRRWRSQRWPHDLPRDRRWIVPSPGNERLMKRAIEQYLERDPTDRSRRIPHDAALHSPHRRDVTNRSPRGARESGRRRPADTHG